MTARWMLAGADWIAGLSIAGLLLPEAVAYSGIAGAPPQGMNTTMPTFASAFDKDWDRPSLYDMINSAMGWSEKTNLYADPASRDAALNRKLSDEEVLAFQSGSLTPELQALVSKYRGG